MIYNIVATDFSSDNQPINRFYGYVNDKLEAKMIVKKLRKKLEYYQDHDMGIFGPDDFNYIPVKPLPKNFMKQSFSKICKEDLYD